MRTPPARTATCLVLAAFLVMTAHSQIDMAFGAPASATIDAKRAEADVANRRVDQLATDLEFKGEELAEIEDAVDTTRKQIASTELKLAAADADLGRSQSILNQRVSSIYRGGKMSIVSVFVGAADFGDFITRLDLMRRVGRSDATVVASVKDAKSRVETARQALVTRQAEQLALRNRARAKRAEVKSAYDAQRKFLADLTGELRKLIAQERERQERIAAQRAAEAAARAAALARNNAGRAGARTFDASTLGQPHPAAVAKAREHLGVPYVWGGVTPQGFDCSGLTRYAYAQIGIDLPRTSRSQFRVGAYIPPDRLDLLASGDLVFFGYDGDPSKIHHVGMYLGGGSYIHAPQSGDVVRIASLTGRIASRGDYVGASRP